MRPNEVSAGGHPAPLVIRTGALPWAPSPSPRVWRKRLEHEGPPEAGRVTSLVRYEPGSVFAPHPHPDGEEILVLEGTFADEHGSYPAGTFMLNPEGYVHAPRSPDGCTLFVKLRQSPGSRKAVSLDTTRAAFEPVRHGVERLELYAEQGFPERIELVRLAPGAGHEPLPGGASGEVFVLSGECHDGTERHAARTWLRIFPRGFVRLMSDTGCLLYVKQRPSPESTAS